ncbi:MAG: fructose-bisphosphate aldolase/6-deoxy-5-ketofructose 1-phosphate synthase [Candidatus Woesearchaeota archaeon]|jgi:fructose-bisphosphate aldolase/6-deoxy-5-ketofructose 1-phosphate synthase
MAKSTKKAKTPTKKKVQLLKASDVKVPLDVPPKSKKAYIDNFLAITKKTGKLMLFAGDQRVEHLNKDFFGANIASDDAHPEHLFRIASKARIGAFAAQLGLIAKFAGDYKKVDYIIKINSKTNLTKASFMDPYSQSWYDVEQLVAFARMSKIKLRGVGYTVYLGSEHEHKMLREAAQMVLKAHEYGLIAVLWMYPRGKSVTNEKDPQLIAGAADVGTCLGADFVKVNYPQSLSLKTADVFKETILAAGRTGIVCAGGSSKDAASFLETLHEQIHLAGTRGSATGRNVHQKPLKEAVAFCNAISAIVFDKASVPDALKIYKKF